MFVGRGGYSLTGGSTIVMETVKRVFWSVVSAVVHGASSAIEWFRSFSQRKGTLLLLGLDNGGKTTLLHLLKTDLLRAHAPTAHPHAEEVLVGNVLFHTHDLGGHAATRQLWRRYASTQIDGIVFVVDAADSDRFAEARGHLLEVIAEPNTVPVAVFANKTDMWSAASYGQLRTALGLELLVPPAPDENSVPSPTRPQDVYANSDAKSSSSTGAHRPVRLFTGSLRHRRNHQAPFQWIANCLNSPSPSNPGRV